MDFRYMHHSAAIFLHTQAFYDRLAIGWLLLDRLANKRKSGHLRWYNHKVFYVSQISMLSSGYARTEFYRFFVLSPHFKRLSVYRNTKLRAFAIPRITILCRCVLLIRVYIYINNQPKSLTK